MNISTRREAMTLFIGDSATLLLALWVTLFIRNVQIPSVELYYSLLAPFSFIFAISFLVFFIAGMYEKHTAILKSRLPAVIFRTQIINTVIAVLFFYLIPYFGVAPKTILFLYITVSFSLTVLWRLYLFDFFVQHKVENAMLVGMGKEIEELVEEINRNGNYGLHFQHIVNLDECSEEEVRQKIAEIGLNKSISLIVIDLEHAKVKPLLPLLYNLIFSKVRFVAMYKVYEDVFKRVPFSILQYNWFLENISISPKRVYDALKRLIDVGISIVGSLITILLYPFVFLAIALDDNGPIFIVQERIGKEGVKINVMKFRSMKTNDRGVWVKEKDDRITRVGKFLRKSRIDEFPQFFNVLRGDLSLIGPRPDIYDLGLSLAEQIPYYAVRNVIAPGISGWAQVSQELPPQSLEETKIRLAYDLFYVKNRSFLLDLQIILKTVGTLLSRTGK